MKPCACVLFVFLCTHLFSAACPAGQGKNEAALIQLEQNWAKALERHDAETVGCILADEFEDADVDGRIHNREQVLAHAAKAFDDPQRTRKEARLERENARLKQLVGALTCELKKSDALLA